MGVQYSSEIPESSTRMSCILPIDMKIAVLMVVLVLAIPATAQQGPAVASPDGKLVLHFETVAPAPGAAAEQLAYSVAYERKPLIAPSWLGLALQGRPVLGAGVKLGTATPGSVDETFQLVHGKAASVRNRYNSLRVEAIETGPGGRTLIVEARAYDDGVAFRYHVPDQPGAKDFRLVQEKTEFRVARDAPAFPSYAGGFLNAYERPHLRTAISGILPDQALVLPLLIEVPGVAWMAITEAALEGLCRNVPETGRPACAHRLRGRIPAQSAGARPESARPNAPLLSLARDHGGRGPRPAA